jgi:hypothetical protein
MSFAILNLNGFDQLDGKQIILEIIHNFLVCFQFL